MKYLIWIGILLIGVSIGFLLGKNSGDVVPMEHDKEEGQTEFITEYIRDTVVHKERIEIPVLTETSTEMDTLIDSTLLSLDVDTTSINPVDSTDLMDLTIHREKKIRQIILPIVYLTEPEEKDTLIKELMGITESKVKSIVVEFWESPLGFSGYKLSRKKLVVYGLSPQLDYDLYKKEKYYYLSAHEVYYEMRETQDFLNYVEVSREVVFND